MVSYILINGYSIQFFMNPLNFVAVILKVLLVNLLAALNFANFLKKFKKTWENKKVKKRLKKRFLHLCRTPLTTTARRQLLDNQLGVTAEFSGGE